MKIKSIPIFLFTLCLVTVVFYNCGPGNSTKSETTDTAVLQQTSLPQDVLQSCVVNVDTLASWFVGGQITENGQVNAANSLLFNPQNNCSFYTWSEQMFLWLTSKDGSGTVFESPDFYTVSPADATGARQLIPHSAGQMLRATSNLAKVETEEGQATDNVLLDRYGNVVYFITMVNDVYAAMVQMAAQYPDSITQFPTSQTQLTSILNYANKNNIPISNPNTLAMELKTSWVKLNGGMNKEDYITINAVIPLYESLGDSTWVLTGDTTATLALVGMHIVGSANGHPELIWSTFEHRSNTPNSSYQYIDTTGKTVTVAPDSTGQWLFNQNAQNTNIADANLSYAKFSNNQIVANKTNSQTIQPSNTIRVLPWGCAYDVQPNQQDTTPAAANSEVIAINNSIINNLKGNDIRKNYIFIGSTWTMNGAVPNGNVYNPTVSGSTAPGAAIGTSSLANSTMETDFQLKPTANISGVSASNTCFTCHNGTLDPKIYPVSPNFIGLSHVFGQLMLGVPQNKQLKK